MTVLIDPPAWSAHGRRWSHLVSDASFDELHAFARATGIPERRFEGDHYDVPEDRYPDLVAAGAVPVPTRELLRRLQNSGLRRPKRRGERVVTSVRRDGVRIDVLRSALTVPGPITAVTVALSGPAGVLTDTRTGRLPRITRSDRLDLLGSFARHGPRVLTRWALPGTGDDGPEPRVVWEQVGYLRTVREEPDSAVREDRHGTGPGSGTPATIEAAEPVLRGTWSAPTTDLTAPARVEHASGPDHAWRPWSSVLPRERPEVTALLGPG